MKLERATSWAELTLPALVFFGAWLANRGAREPRRAPTADASMPVAPRVSREKAPTIELVRATTFPVRDPGPVDSHAGPVYPHPSTHEHARIQRENQVLGRLNDALDLRDAVALRRELERYEQEYPDDPNQLQNGYRVILACLESPGRASTLAAQRYYDEERGSTLRRFVARTCLGQ